MKEIEAPEKIYLQVCGDCPQSDCENCKFEDLEDNVTWCKDKIFKKDIEYTRTDAFIEKAKTFICNHIDGSGLHINYVLKEFENYMKGE